MSAPVSKFSRLSLGGMTTTAHSQSRRLSCDSASSLYESDSDFEGETSANIVRSPSKLTYNLERLPETSRTTVKETFHDPPQISLNYCRLRDNVYAFQMTELVPRSIRIGSPESGFSTPQCSCGKQGSMPCNHLLWLQDQLTKEYHYTIDPRSPLTMTDQGYAEEAGDPYSNIASFHLDILADDLHCEVINPDSDEETDVSPRRVHESHELLSAVSETDPEQYRPDLRTNQSSLGKHIMKRGDLECTVFRMLLENNEFFHYFLNRSRASDPIRDPFRKLEQRVALVLRELDAYSAAVTSTAATAAAPVNTSFSSSSSVDEARSFCPEGPRDVTWAARHVTGAVRLIRTSIFKRDTPLAQWERRSAARALVHIFASVVDRNRQAHPKGRTMRDRNLYARLIGDAPKSSVGDSGGHEGEDDDYTDDFIIGTLLLIPDAAAPFLQNLEDISEAVGVHGAPGTFADKLKKLLAVLRKSSSSSSSSSAVLSRSGSKRLGRHDSGDRGSKRVK